MSRVRAAIAVVTVLVTVALYALVWTSAPSRQLTAHFSRAVGIHAGSDVRVLGVKVGTVESVVPEGRTVRVVMKYPPERTLPADVRAIIVPPSVVSDRYVQLAPAYVSGPRLLDGADVPLARTVAPLELDDIYHALDEFNKALGPNGANAGGALSDLVATGRANLEGNGDELHATLDGLSKALSTLSDGRQDLFGTVANLAQFTNALERSDQQIRQFNDQLANVAGQLAGERDELAAALHSLAIALADISTFIRDNRDELKANVAGLADLTGVLVRQQRAIVDVLDIAPLALSNLNLAYNGRSGTLDTRDNALGPYEPAAFVCSLLVDLVPLPQVPRECFALAQALSTQHLPLSDQLKRLLGLPPGSATATVPPGPATTAPGSPGLSAVPGLPGGLDSAVDNTLGGILRGTP
jgi:phospholipid/cholesterol/gamma-HCH transport system substrate-binding protein